MPGQPQLGTNPILGIDCNAFVVADPADPLGPSNLIIPAGTPFEVAARFQLGGLLAPWLVATTVPYTVTYYFEGMGGAPEGTLGTKADNTSAGKLIYAGADTKFTGALGTPGTYRLTAVVSLSGPPVSAFIEGPMIQIQ